MILSTIQVENKKKERSFFSFTVNSLWEKETEHERILFRQRFMLITWDLVLNNLSECSSQPLVLNIKVRDFSLSLVASCSQNVQFLIGLFPCILLSVWVYRQQLVRRFIRKRKNQLNRNQLAMSPQTKWLGREIN